jgi:hypothetical protein
MDKTFMVLQRKTLLQSSKDTQHLVGSFELLISFDGLQKYELL